VDKKSQNGRKRRIMRVSERDSMIGGRASDEENLDPNMMSTLEGALLDFGLAGHSDGDDVIGYGEGGLDDDEGLRAEEEGIGGGGVGPRVPLLEREDDEGEDLYGEDMARYVIYC
jgi:hypothetical protein